jgi:hypothetical protein
VRKVILIIAFTVFPFVCFSQNGTTQLEIKLPQEAIGAEEVSHGELISFSNNTTCPLSKVTPESIFVSKLLFYSGIAILVAICVAFLIFIYLIFPKKIKTCPASTLAKAKKIVIPNRIDNVVIKQGSKEFNDIISNFDDRRQSSDPQVASITLHVFVNITKYTLQVSMAGWNFLGEERNSRRLLNNIQVMDTIASLLEKLRPQSKGVSLGEKRNE